MEHLHHFGLSEDPFCNEPLLRHYFETEPHGAALRRLERAVRQRKGLCVLSGQVGAGKTMVVRRLYERLEEEVFEASLMVVLQGAADARWLFSRFARQLGVEEPAVDHSELLGQIYERLAIVREDGRHAVLIIDDADTLASGSALAEVCAVLKLEYEDRRLLTLVLAGGPGLEYALTIDGVLAHRVDVHARLAGFDAEGTSAYLDRRLAQAGGTPQLIHADARAALHELGRGLPALMNTLADNAFFEAFLCGRGQVTRTDVERAHADLGWGEGVQSTAAPASASTALGREDDLDSELDAVFAPAAPVTRAPEVVQVADAAPAPTPIVVASADGGMPTEGPPKEEGDEEGGVVIELIED